MPPHWSPVPGSFLHKAFHHNTGAQIQPVVFQVDAAWRSAISILLYWHQNAYQPLFCYSIRSLHRSNSPRLSFSAVPGRSGTHWWQSGTARCRADCLPGNSPIRSRPGSIHSAAHHWRLRARPPSSGYASIVFPGTYGSDSCRPFLW